MTSPIPLTVPTILKFKETFPLAHLVPWWTENWQAGTVTVPEQVAITADLLYSSEGFAFTDSSNECLFTWKLRTQPPEMPPSTPTKILQEPIISLSQDGYRNYYHWMTEILPKLRFLPRLDPEEAALIAVPTSGPAFIKESLQLLLKDSKRTILWLEEGVAYRSAKGIIVITPAPLFGFVPDEVIDFLLFSMTSSTTLTYSPTTRKIFVSRRTSSRRILNEDQIYHELFAPLGFTFHVLDHLSLSSQILLFQEAQVVAGEHGAAFTNIIFSKPGCLLIEIFQGREDASFYYLTQGRWRWVGIKTVEFEETGAMNWEKGEQMHVPIEPIQSKLRELQENGEI